MRRIFSVFTIALLGMLMGCASSEPSTESGSVAAPTAESPTEPTPPDTAVATESAPNAAPTEGTPTATPPATPPKTQTFSTPGVLEEVSDAELTPDTKGVPVNPAFTKLRTKLQELGYEAVGLEYEPTAVLTLLYKVFSSPQLKNRKIQRVYTGMHLEYDAKAQALTVGGTQNVSKILAFIKKKVPARPAH